MKEVKDDGGPAFPRTANDEDRRSDVYSEVGMSLRDWFAGQALAGMIDFSGSISYEMDEKCAHVAAETAFKFADAMLKARSEVSS